MSLARIPWATCCEVQLTAVQCPITDRHAGKFRLMRCRRSLVRSRSGFTTCSAYVCSRLPWALSPTKLCTQGVDYSEVKERIATKSMLASKNVRPSLTKMEEVNHWLRVLSSELAIRLAEARESSPAGAGIWPKSIVVGFRQGMRLECLCYGFGLADTWYSFWCD